jgi:hypothetical protein
MPAETNAMSHPESTPPTTPEPAGSNSMTVANRRSRAVLAWIVGLTTIGVGIRVLFLLAVGDLEPHADESNYLYLAALWNHFGVYGDGVKYLWPPGYPLFLAACLKMYGDGGIFAAKLCQALLAGSIGASTMLLANRLFNAKVARVAGIIWCVYLPLIGFTHYLWPETIYLAVLMPTLYLLVSWRCRTDGETGGNGRLIAAGLLAGLGLLIKEAGIGWCAGLVLLIAARGFPRSPARALRGATLFVVAAAVVVLPWTLRNYEVYGRLAPTGATLGQNVFLGMNGAYINFDYPQPMLKRLPEINPWVHRELLTPPAQNWERSTAGNVIDQSAENVRRGLTYAREHPRYALTTRIKKLADWATPWSFFLRHYALGRYHGVLMDAGVRRLLIVSALVLPILVLLLAIPGFLQFLRSSGGRAVIGWTFLYFAPTTALINGMSRYRISIEPLLIVLAAGIIGGGLRAGRRSGWAVACVIGWLMLGTLWAVNAAEVTALLREIW